MSRIARTDLLSYWTDGTRPAEVAPPTPATARIDLNGVGTILGVDYARGPDETRISRWPTGRLSSRAASFGLMYGLSPEALSRTVRIPPELIDADFSGIEERINAQFAEALRRYAQEEADFMLYGTRGRDDSIDIGPWERVSFDSMGMLVDEHPRAPCGEDKDDDSSVVPRHNPDVQKKHKRNYYKERAITQTSPSGLIAALSRRL